MLLMTNTASKAQTLLACLRRQHFAVLSTSDASSIPASAGVSYGASQSDLVIYVMTRRNLQKARNIAEDPQVSLVVPVARRLAWFLPPATMQTRISSHSGRSAYEDAGSDVENTFVTHRADRTGTTLC